MTADNGLQMLAMSNCRVECVQLKWRHVDVPVN